MICWKCGHENPDDKNYCSECGASLWTADASSGQNGQSTMDESQLMVCWKCGHLNPEGKQFCSACGADIWHADLVSGGGPEIAHQPEEIQPRPKVQPQPEKIQPRPKVQPQTGYSGNSASAGLSGQESGAVYIKIAAMIFAVGYLLGAIGMILSGVMGLFTMMNSDMSIFVSLVDFLISVLTAAVSALSAGMFFLLGMRLTKKNGEMMYLGIVITTALRIVTVIISHIWSAVLQRMYYWYRVLNVFKSSIVWEIVGVVFAAVVFYVLFLIAGEKPLLGKSLDELKQMLKDFPAMLQQEIKQFSSKRAAAKPVSDGTGEGNYNKPQTLPPAPANPNQLKTNRGIFKFVIFTLLTCGIYAYYFYYIVAKDINTICREDGENTAGLIKHILLNLITCGIYEIIWQYQFADRMYSNAPRYGITVQETGTTVLLWWLLGSICCGIGPCVAMYIQIKNLNKMAKAYNERYFI